MNPDPTNVQCLFALYVIDEVTHLNHYRFSLQMSIDLMFYAFAFYLSAARQAYQPCSHSGANMQILITKSNSF